MRSRRTLPKGAALVIAAALVVSIAVSEGGDAIPTLPHLRANPDIGVFQGLGVWVDIYDHPAWADPAAAVRAMADHGVKTLYLETSNFNRPSAFVYAKRTGQFVDAAHADGVHIVAWYLPSFKNPSTDAQRAEAAISFHSPAGNRFDGFGLDIESPEVAKVAARTTRLIQLSADLRSFAGDGYPLGAIIPSPYGMVVNKRYWPGFPYTQLAEVYDAILPMSYFTWHHHTGASTHWYIAKNVSLIRQGVGSDQVPIHVIGGIAQDASIEQAKAFVAAVREGGLIGASYYTFPGVDDAEWSVLDQIPSNPVEVPAGPIPLHVGGPMILGNVPGADATHPNEVVFTTGSRLSDQLLGYDAYDAQSGEISIYVNWELVGAVEAGPDGDWTGPRTITIPASSFSRTASNTIAFVPSDPGGVWGIRNVSIAKSG